MSSHFIPRLQSSTKWTDLPTEFTSKIKSIFSDQFKIESNHGDFLVEGRIYPEEIVIRLGYLESGRLKQINFEASMNIPPKDAPGDSDEAGASMADPSGEPILGGEKKSSTMELIYTAIDALGSIMEEYFETDDEDELDVPNQWKEFNFEGSQVFLQYSTINTQLEVEADRILGLLNDALVQEKTNDEDALNAAEIDTELALEVQRIIREGKHPLQNPLQSMSGSERDGDGRSENDEGPNAH